MIGLHTGAGANGQPQAAAVGTDDVANGILFLASDDAKKINGVLMPIDNAWSTI